MEINVHSTFLTSLICNFVNSVSKFVYLTNLDKTVNKSFDIDDDYDRF